MNVAQTCRRALLVNTLAVYYLEEEDEEEEEEQEEQEQAVFQTHENPNTNANASQRVPSKTHYAHFPISHISCPIDITEVE